MNTALLLLEIQNDYFPNGRTPLERSTEACAKAQLVLHAFRTSKLPILHLQQISTHPNATYHLPCTIGAEIHASVQPLKHEIIVKKHYPNSFKDTSLLSHLKKLNIKHVVICGMMTHMAIDATVRAAFDHGLSVTVLQDACAARQLEFHHSLITAYNVHLAFMAALHHNYAVVQNTEDYLQKVGVRTPVQAV